MKGTIYLSYVSKYRSEREKQVIPLMITHGEVWHNIAVKK